MAFEYAKCTIFREADCNTDHNLVVEKLMEMLALNKQAAHNVERERFNLRNLNEVMVRKSIILTNQRDL
jgi:hypothetical protein